MSDAVARYDDDLFLWSQQQGVALREAAARGVNLPVDWENVAEEIESLGKRDRREVESRLETIIEHLLKLQHSPQADPRNGWTETVLRERSTLHKALRDSPSLRAQSAEIMAEVAPTAVRRAARALETYAEYEAARAIERLGARYTLDQVVGDWFPPDPTA